MGFDAVDPGAEAAKPAEETPSASAAEPPAATTQATSEPATESAAPASTPAAAAAGDSRSLSFNFHGTSWVRVQDATGHTLLTGVISAGEHQTVQGTPPFSVFLGNAPAVDVEYAGAPLKIDSYVKANSTARFNVPLSAPSP